MAKTKAKKSGVEVGVWQARIAAAKLMFARERRKREEYERSLALDDGLTDWSAFDNISQAYGSSTLKKVPLSYRYTVWLQAQTAGDPPIIKYPRSATGDETFAVTVEELLGRVHLESGAHREWAQGIFDIAGAGSTCIWYGFHADVVTPEEVEGASEGAGQTVERALQGDIEAKPGQPYLVEEYLHSPAVAAPDGKNLMPAPRLRPLVHAASQIRRVCELPGSPFVLLTKEEA